MFESIRDAKLIEEQLVYEENFFESAQADIEKSKEMDYQILNHESNIVEYVSHDDFPELDSEHYSDFEFKDALRMEMMMYDEMLSPCEECFKPQFEEDVFDYQLEEYEFIAEPQIVEDYSFDKEELQFEECLNELVKQEPVFDDYFIEVSFPDIEKSEEFDSQINSYEIENDYIPEYEYYDFEDDYYFEEINMDAAYYGCELRGYVVDDDPFENLDGIYY